MFFEITRFKSSFYFYLSQIWVWIAYSWTHGFLAALDHDASDWSREPEDVSIRLFDWLSEWDSSKPERLLPFVGKYIWALLLTAVFVYFLIGTVFKFCLWLAIMPLALVWCLLDAVRFAPNSASDESA